MATIPQVTREVHTSTPEAKTEFKLGANEFFGLCMRYNVLSCYDDFWLPGSLDASIGTSVPVFFEHVNCVGMGRLLAHPEGIAIHGRLVGCWATNNKILAMIAMGLCSGLCLSTTSEAFSATTPDGRILKVIHRATPTECSIVFTSGVPNTGITMLGPVDPKKSEWDAAMLRDEMLNQLESEIAEFHRTLRAAKVANSNLQRSEYESWIKSVEI